MAQPGLPDLRALPALPGQPVPPDLRVLQAPLVRLVLLERPVQLGRQVLPAALLLCKWER